MKSILDEFLEKLPEEFNMMELFARAEEKTPYVLVALQECERMNGLTREMKRSLKEVDLGLKVWNGIYYTFVYKFCAPPCHKGSFSRSNIAPPSPRNYFL